jgi:E3 ubiquitin-protein ligase RNF115/126
VIANSADGFEHILEQLMHAAGPQGPLPASDIVIEGLPRLTFTEESLGELCLIR